MEPFPWKSLHLSSPAYVRIDSNRTLVSLSGSTKSLYVSTVCSKFSRICGSYISGSSVSNVVRAIPTPASLFPASCTISKPIPSITRFELTSVMGTIGGNTILHEGSRITLPELSGTTWFPLLSSPY